MSMSSIFMPVILRTSLIAGAGPMPMIVGSHPEIFFLDKSICWMLESFNFLTDSSIGDDFSQRFEAVLLDCGFSCHDQSGRTVGDALKNFNRKQTSRVFKIMCKLFLTEAFPALTSPSFWKTGLSLASPSKIKNICSKFRVDFNSGLKMCFYSNIWT